VWVVDGASELVGGGPKRFSYIPVSSWSTLRDFPLPSDGSGYTGYHLWRTHYRLMSDAGWKMVGKVLSVIACGCLKNSLLASERRNLRDRKCLGERQTSIVGHRSAILFL